MSNDYDTEQGNWQDYVNPASGVPRISISPQGGNGVSQLVNPDQTPDAPQQRGVIDKLLGLTGERYQLWPERMARSGFSLPGDVASGRTATTDPASGEISDELISRVQDLAGLVGSGSLPAAAMSRDIGTLGMAGGKLTQPDRYLLPAYKLRDKIFKGEAGQDHTEIVPPEIIRKAGTDDPETLIDVLDNYPGLERGYVNHKGQFLLDEKAGQYALDNQLLRPDLEDYIRKNPGILTSDMLLSDSGDVGAPLSALEHAPGPFYSAMEHAVRNAPQDKMSAQQWVGWLKNQPGVKQEELDWVGLPRNGGPVTKQELLDHVAGHGAQIKEVEKGQADLMSDPRLQEYIQDNMRSMHEAAYEGEPNAPDYENLRGAELNDYRNMIRESLLDEAKEPEFFEDMHGFHPGDAKNNTKFSDYQLPGGDNYRELLLTLPENTQKMADLRGKMATNLRQKYGDNFSDHWNDAEKQAYWNTAKKSSFTSSHWDEPNVLVHMRMNDRFIPDGVGTDTNAVPRYQVQHRDDGYQILEYQGQDKPFKVYPELKFKSKQDADAWVKDHPAEPGLWVEPKSIKSLHLEEVQSDWHQQGRKQGYKSDSNLTGEQRDALLAERDKLSGEVADIQMADRERGYTDTHNNPEYTQRMDRITEINKKIEGRDGVPDAPFKTTWADLALKRAITKAAREGYDAVSWTPGEQQAARYDLSKHIDKLEYLPPGKSSMYPDGRLIAYKDGRSVIDKAAKPEELPDLIGKEAADKMLKAEVKKLGYGPLEGHTLENADLKVGGEGMKKFYDKMLVDKANAIAKKFGAKVEYKDLPQSHDASNNTPFDSRDRALQVVNHGGEIYAFGPKSGGEHYITSQEALEQFENDFTGPYQYVLGDKQPPLKVPVLRLTDKMKDAALRKGMPLFSAGVPFSFTPVDHDPFKDDNK